MADFRARIETFADISQASNTINSFVSQARKLRIDVDLNVTSANQAVSNMLSNLQAQARSAGSSAGSQFASAFNGSMGQIRTDQMANQMNNLSNALRNKFNFDTSAINNITQNLSNMNVEIEKVQTRTRSNGTLDVTVKGIDSMGRAVTIAKNFDSAGKQLNSTLTTLATAEKLVSDQSKTTFNDQMTAWARNNTKAVQEYGDRLNELRSRLQSVNTESEFKQVKADFRSLQAEARATGNIGKTISESFASSLGTVSRFVASYISIYRIFNELKEGVKTVVELDNALVDLQKTSTATPAQLNSFYREANDIAKQYGATTKEIIQGAAD